MKRTFAFLIVLAIAGLYAFKPVAADTFSVDADKSTVTWIGRKVTGQHTGTIKLASGSLAFAGNNLTGGSFVIDMNTITSDGGDQLLTHLKSEDFFSVAKNPTANLTITKVAPGAAGEVMITGNLTIKGTTQPVSFAASVKRTGNTVTASAKKILVDRTKYDIRYGSKSFFASIGDKAIDDEFELAVNLVATKK